MRHRVDGRKLGRNTSHRKALFKNIANAVIEQERITTTVQKAKEVRRVVDRLITLAKKGSHAAKRLAFSRTRNNKVVRKLFSTLAQRYQERAGGYTRVLTLSERRWGDAAQMAILELVDHPLIDRKKKIREKTDQENEKPQPRKEKDPFEKVRKFFNRSKKLKKTS